MSILIKGMEMPKEQPLRIVLNLNGQLFVDRGVHFTEYEAVEVPTTHGDLIDRDVLIKSLRDYACKPCKEYGADRDGVRCEWCSFDDAFARIEKAKKVIPAERTKMENA